MTHPERVVKGYADAGGFLFGRRTYENLAAYWPNASEEEQVIAQPLNTKPKYVASRTLTEPLEWQNSTLLTGDIAEAVLGLKQEDGGDLHVIGSSEFAQGLIEHDLVDEYRLMIDPLVVGGGKRLFRDGGLKPLRLARARRRAQARSSRRIRQQRVRREEDVECTCRSSDQTNCAASREGKST